MHRSGKRYATILYILIALLAAPLVLAGVALYYMTAMPGTSYRGELPPLTAAETELAGRLRRHVVAIANREHNVAHLPQLEQAAVYIERALTGYGYPVRRQEFQAAGQRVRNIEVAIPRVRPNPRQRRLIVVGAHYDSAPGTPGANDNGSGTAAVIELARLLHDLRPADGYEVRLVLFVNEEVPYFKTEQMGSWVHANVLHAGGEEVAAMLSLETLGFYSDAKGSQKYPAPFSWIYPDTGNFVGFVGELSARPLVRRVVASFRRHARFPSEGVAAPGAIPGIDWSDHWAYAQFNYPALMVTDTAPFRYPHYHTADDVPQHLDYARLARVVKGIEGVVRDLVAF